MPYTESGLAKCRDTIATQLVGSTDGNTTPLAIGSGRAILGYNARAVSDSDLYDDLVANGPLAIVGFPMGGLEVQSLTGTMRIPIILFVAKNKSADWTGTDIVDLVSSVLSRLATASAFTSGAFPPVNVSVDSWDWDYRNNPGVVAVTFSFTLFDPMVLDGRPGSGGMVPR